METAALKAKLHELVESGDERFLGLVYALAKEYNKIDADHEFSEADIAEYDETVKRYEMGEEKLYSWEEAKAIIRGEKDEDGI